MKPGVPLLLLGLSAHTLRAQCPNGAPPPCPAATVALNAPLNDRTWLILPFENTARNADAELIRHAGLNLLYQELSQWRDVRVVSDDRVDDLMRSLPEAQRIPLGLEPARALARRVGAAQVVLGDYLAVGPQAQIAAKVYDVRTGNQIRLVRERLVGFTGGAALDSMSATYSRLGAKIMGLPPRAGRPVLAGTSSMDAFRAYIEGQDALNRTDFAAARRHFARAVSHDSTYAEAQFGSYQMEVDSTVARRHLQAAVRNAVRLPDLDRARIDLAVAMDSTPAAVCAPAARVMALDSLDSWAWIGTARCETRVRPFRPFPGDTNKRLFGGNVHRARIAARRALELDPGSIHAFLVFMNAVQLNQQVPLCERLGAGACPLDSLWAGAAVVQGDSVLMVLERWSLSRGDPPYLRPEVMHQRRASYMELRRASEAFLARYPGNVGAQTALAVSRAETGDMRGAVSLADSTRGYVDGIRILGPVTRLMIALAGDQTDFTQAVAAYYADSSHNPQGQMYGMLGRYREDAARGTPAAARALEPWLPIMAGVLPAGFDSIETALAARQTSAVGRANVLEMSTLLAFRMRGRGPALDTGAVHPVRRAQAWLARGDTAKARASIVRFDSTLMRREPVTVDDGGWMFAAETYAAIGDSARAFAVMLDWRRRWPNTMKHPNQRILDQNIYVSMPRLFGREWLLLGDLALARGDRAEARNAYQMVLRLWEGGDAPVQPLVARARAALARP